MIKSILIVSLLLITSYSFGDEINPASPQSLANSFEDIEGDNQKIPIDASEAYNCQSFSPSNGIVEEDKLSLAESHFSFKNIGVSSYSLTSENTGINIELRPKNKSEMVGSYGEGAYTLKFLEDGFLLKGEIQNELGVVLKCKREQSLLF